MLGITQFMLFSMKQIDLGGKNFLKSRDLHRFEAVFPIFPALLITPYECAFGDLMFLDYLTNAIGICDDDAGDV